MPLYEYQCGRCGRFELIQKFSDAPLATCPTCGQDVHKLLSAPAFQFKGTGWYVTDYARKSGGDGEGKTDTASSTAKESASKDAASKDSSSPTTTTSKDSSASSTGSSPSK